MNHYRSTRRFVLTWSFILASTSSTFGLVHSAAAQSQAAADLGYYLHYKTGMHDYMYGPGGVMPRYFGLPAQQPTYGQLPSRTRVIVIHLARCEALNLQVTVPSKAWTKVDPRTTGSRANFLLTRHNPDLNISLAGERVGVEAKETNKALLAESQDKMKNLPGATVLPGEWQVSGQNIQGICYHAMAEQDDASAYYSNWVATRNGYSYKLSVFGPKKYKPAIDTTMHNFVHNLRQMDSKRIAHAERKRADVAFLTLEEKEKAPPKEPEPFAEPLVR